MVKHQFWEVPNKIRETQMLHFRWPSYLLDTSQAEQTVTDMDESYTSNLHWATPQDWPWILAMPKWCFCPTILYLDMEKMAQSLFYPPILWDSYRHMLDIKNDQWVVAPWVAAIQSDRRGDHLRTLGLGDRWASAEISAEISGLPKDRRSSKVIQSHKSHMRYLNHPQSQCLNVSMSQCLNVSMS